MFREVHKNGAEWNDFSFGYVLPASGTSRAVVPFFSLPPVVSGKVLLNSSSSKNLYE